MATVEKQVPVMDCVQQHLELLAAFALHEIPEEEFAAKLRPVLLAETSCPVCSATFLFADTVKSATAAHPTLEFFCPNCLWTFKEVNFADYA